MPAINPQLANCIPLNSFYLSSCYLGSSVTLLNKQGEPFLVYKMARHPSLNHFFKNHEECLLRAHELGFSVPPFYGSSSLDGKSIIIVGWIKGRKYLDSQIQGRTNRVIPKDALRLLQDLQMKTRKQSADLSQLRSRCEWWKAMIFSLDKSCTGIRRIVECVLSGFMECMSQSSTVVMHGDFVGVNLLINKQNRISVIDWELGMTSGAPLIDLISFIIDTETTAYKIPRGDIFRKCFFDKSSTRSYWIDILDEYCDTMNICNNFAKIFILTTLIKMVAEDCHYAVMHGGPIRARPFLEDLRVLNDHAEQTKLLA